MLSTQAGRPLSAQSDGLLARVPIERACLEDQLTRGGIL
jgi:hypothetical protein